MRVLLVEDEEELAGMLNRVLEAEGFAVDQAVNGAEAIYFSDNNPYDLVLLDRILPDMDGLEILKRMRGRESLTPVIVVTVRGRVPERVEGLSHGADDYLVKPFEVSELLARIRAVLRRGAGVAEDRMVMDDLEVDLARRVVTRAGVQISLTVKEFALVAYLLRKRGHVVSRKELTAHLYNDDFDGDSNLIDVFIHKVRRKVDREPHKRLIHTVRGAGYTMSEAWNQGLAG